MKILNVIMSIDTEKGGGAVERVCNLSKYLSLNGHDCTILTTSKNFNKKRIKSLGKVKVVMLPYVLERYLIPIGLFSWLRSNAHNFDRIHLSLNWSVITAMTFVFLKLNKIDYYFSAMGWLTIAGNSRFFKLIYKYLFTYPMITNAKICIAITKNEVNDYLKFGIKKKKISLIPNGVDSKYYLKKHSYYDFKKKHNIENKRVIFFIGRIDKIKGTDLLLKAFYKIQKKNKNIHLVICGFDGGILPELKIFCKRNEITSKVTFIDPIWGREKIFAYKSAEVCVIPSRFDTMTIVALEAGILSTPIIITKQCNFKGIKKSKGALEVDSSINSISKGLQNILSNKKRLFLMKKKIKMFVIKNYSWNIIVLEFIKLFKTK
jgi:glycosyltransferase involved in cell wall biosynthesis